MTKIILKKPIIATIATLLVVTVLITSNSLIAQAGTSTTTTVCPPDGEVEHWDKIVFEIDKDESDTISEDNLKARMDIKILDAPDQIINLEERVADLVGAQFGVDPADLKIKIKDVLYQTVSCASGGSGSAGPTGPAGADGAVGPTGPPGADGTVGATGPAGPGGADGPIPPADFCDEVASCSIPAGADGADGAVGPTGPAGADGDDGAVGPTGPAGTGPTQSLMVTDRFSSSVELGPGSHVQFVAVCLADEFVTGGGWRHTAGPLNADFNVLFNFPFEPSNGWLVGITNEETSDPISFQAHVLCAKLT